MMSRNYILCTVARNEDAYFPQLANNVLAQSQRPCLWVLLDDQSIDHTNELMKTLASKHPWIHFYRYDAPRLKELGLHLARIKAHVTRLAVRIALEKRLSYEFVGLLDADIQIPPGFYAEMIEQMFKAPGIGLASANIQEFTRNGKLYLRKSRDDLPGCATLLCRRSCFNDIGGVDPEVYPEDAIMVARAKLRNWDTKRFNNITVIQMRETSSNEGLQKGYLFEGEKIYFLRYRFIYVLARTIYIGIFHRIDYGIIFFWGYFAKFLRSNMRLEDEELKNYFRKKRFKEILVYRLRDILSYLKRMVNY